MLDISLPDGNWVTLVEWLRRHAPDTYIVMATIFDDDDHLFTALRAGAHGYLLKDQPRERLIEQLGGILRGEPPLSPSIARRMMRHFRQTTKPETGEDPLLTETGSDLGQKVVRPLWGTIQDQVMTQLDAMSIDDLCNQANDAGIESEGRKNLDFII